MAEPLLSFLLHAAVPDVEEVTRPYGLEATRDKVAIDEATTRAIGCPLSRADAVMSPTDGDLAQRLASICTCALRGRLLDVMTVSAIVLRWVAAQEARLRAESDEEQRHGAARGATVMHCNALTLACGLRIHLEALCLALAPTQTEWRGVRSRPGASPHDSQFVADGRGALRRAVENGEVVFAAGASGTPDHESVRRVVDVVAQHVDEIRGNPSSPMGPRFGLRMAEPAAPVARAERAPPTPIDIGIGVDEAGFISINNKRPPSPGGAVGIRSRDTFGQALLALPDGVTPKLATKRISELNQVVVPFGFQLRPAVSVPRKSNKKVAVQVVAVDPRRPIRLVPA